jgi:octaheme c-type cytochrome (tetrathionate reductase family)
MTDHPAAAPLSKRILTPGVTVLFFLVGIGLVAIAIRLIQGIGAVSNLSNQHPWGIWIAIDVVSGVALAAGGFTTCGLVYVLQRRHFASVLRPALLTALLGYTFVVLALIVDIGRWWNIWSPMIHWNGNSVLFEVAMCVMFYLTVLYIEFIPVVAERFREKVSLPGLPAGLNVAAEKGLAIADHVVGRVMGFLIVCGIVLSCLHQSSLGALMLIAPSKVHPLWYTPILPLLFLLSAIAVGLPMVVFESVAAARALGREVETDVLSGLARLMPFLIGLYLAVRVGDLLARGAWVHLFAHSPQATSCWFELVFGLFVPFAMLLLQPVRRSPGWLFWASTLFILGVLLNRINVFWVGFRSPYQDVSYFPAVGELAVTVGFVAALILAYRIGVSVFPVLKAEVSPKKSLICVLALLPFLGGPGQVQAADRPDKIQAVVALRGPSIEEAKSFLVLDSPVIRESGDLYGPVRFMHRRHALLVQDCTVCHHRIPREEGDDYGVPADPVAMAKDKTLPVACHKCHARPWPAKQLHKPGLKGAYHQMCLGCHRESAQMAGDPNPGQIRQMLSGGVMQRVGRAPVDCRSCHTPTVPSHREWVSLKANAKPVEVTAACLSCHRKQGQEILKSSHWLWEGPSPRTVGHEKRTDFGKRRLGLDNSLISAVPNRSACTRCHIGYGWRDEKFDFSDPMRVDCLVCHDTTGTYRKGDGAAGLPAKGLNLTEIAQRAGRPGRNACGNACHFSGGKADFLAHGGLSGRLKAPERALDVHMAGDGANMVCQDCHHTRAHRISGVGVGAGPSEGDVACSSCHSRNPHPRERQLATHLNRHTDHLACQTCHIPVYAKGAPMPVRWDWTATGDATLVHQPATPEPGPWGSRIWMASDLTPSYRWFNGKVLRHLPGDPVAPRKSVDLNLPQGDVSDPGARIHPFLVRTGRQPVDAQFYYLIAPRWPQDGKEIDWNAGLAGGMQQSNLPYSGQHEFVETVSYQGVNHEVLSKDQALSCRDCHGSLAETPSCGRCHQPKDGWNFEALALKGSASSHPAQPVQPRIDFRALGYPDDPIRVGGRFTRLPLLMTGPSQAGPTEGGQGDFQHPLR